MWVMGMRLCDKAQPGTTVQVTVSQEDSMQQVAAACSTPRLMWFVL
jgi:hypothetical protein